MTRIAVDTGTMKALAQRVDSAIRVVSDLEGRLGDLGTRAAEFQGPAEPVAHGLKDVVRVVGANTRGSADDLARLRDSIVALAELWAASESLVLAHHRSKAAPEARP